MKKYLVIFFTLLAFTMAMSCASAPDEEPVAEEAIPDEETAAGVTEEKISDSEWEEVKAAILKAEEAGASEFANSELTSAKDSLSSAEKESDILKAREELANAKNSADSAYAISVAAQKEDYLKRIDALVEKIKDLQAEKYDPLGFAGFDGTKATVETAFEKSFSDGKESAESSIEELQTYYKELDEKIRWVKILKRDTENFLEDAEKAEAYIWAIEDLDKANELYFAGLDAFRTYNLTEAEKLLSDAKYSALQASKNSKEQKVLQETEDFMLEVMKEIEEASQNTVITDEDEIITPEPWTGDKLLDSTKEEESVEEEEIIAEEGENTSSLSGIQELVIALPFNGEAAVLGDLSLYTYLDKAKKLWLDGVKEKNAGNMVLANEYFKEAQAYVRLYQANAVNKVYKVKYNPERRDCLWRISERDDIYGNPFLWPKIWRRNRKQIQNPDLIYPGWNLIIPPQ